MNFNFLSLIKSQVRIKITGNEEMEGTLSRVFSDYIVIENELSDKLMINKNCIICIYEICSANKNKETE